MTATPVLEIAEVGFDVKTCADYQKAFSSKFPTMKTQGVYRVPSLDVAYHHLGYQPIFMYASYLTDDTSKVGLIGQISIEFGALIMVDDDEIRSYFDAPEIFAADALVYVFIEELL